MSDYKKKYIILKDILVQNANAESSYITTGISLSSFIGFLDAFKYKLNHKYDVSGGDDLYDEDIPPVDILKRDGVAVILKNYQRTAGTKRMPNTLFKDKRNNLNPAFFQIKEKLYDCQTTLVFELSTSLTDVEEIEMYFKHHVLNSRIAGGKIVDVDNIENKIFVEDSLDKVNEKLKKEKGWLISDKSNDFQAKFQELGAQEAIKHYLFSFYNEKYKKENQEKKFYKKEKGWFFASFGGYHLIEKESYKKNSRNNLKHAYAEPFISIFELVFFKKIGENHFFKWHKEKNSFAIKT